jgi:hypothetical protein
LGRAENDLELVQEGLTVSQANLTLDSGTHYYWQIMTVDSEGNTSMSAVFGFQTAD